MNRLFTILLLLTTPIISIGQDMTEKSDTSHRFIIGFNLGSNFSSLQSIHAKPNNSFGLGFSTGAFIATRAKHFSLRLSLLYDFTKYKISYTSKYSSSPANWPTKIADYYLYNSNIRSSILASYLFGRKIKYYFFIGPEYMIPISNSAKGQIHETGWWITNPSDHYDYYIYDNDINCFTNWNLYVIIGTGLKKRIKKNDIGFEFNYGFGVHDFWDNEPPMKENYLKINLVYFLKFFKKI